MMMIDKAINCNLSLLEFMKIENMLHPNCVFADDNFEALEMANSALKAQSDKDKNVVTITDEQAIEHLQSTGWMQNHDREIYESGLREQLADDSGSYDSLIPSEDTISRQAAINAIMNTDETGYIYWKTYYKDLIEALPSAQPEQSTDIQDILQYLDNVIHPLVSPENWNVYSELHDMISNLPSAQPESTRTFVELVVEYPDPELCTYKEYKGKPYYSIKYIENGETYVGYSTYNPEVLSQYLKEYFISSAQPEIVRCKDCKWKQGAECVRFADVRPFPDDFCSRAERRTDEL